MALATLAPRIRKTWIDEALFVSAGSIVAAFLDWALRHKAVRHTCHLSTLWNENSCGCHQLFNPEVAVLIAKVRAIDQFCG